MVDKDNTKTLEESKIKEVASDLREKGYDVVIYPSQKELPPFLEDFSPDIVARKGKENLIIEIRSRYTLDRAKYLEHVATRIQEHSDWSFELVVTNPKDERQSTTISSEFVLRRKLSEAELLLENGNADVAFLLGWATLEACSRRSLSKIPSITPEINPAGLIRQLFAFGLIRKSDFSFLERLLNKRNRLVHGFFDSAGPTSLESARLMKLCKIMLDD